MQVAMLSYNTRLAYCITVRILATSNEAVVSNPENLICVEDLLLYSLLNYVH